MKNSIVILGICVVVVGLLSFWSTINWVIFPNLFSFLSFLGPYYHYIIVIGVIMFLVGLIMKGGD